MARNVNAWMEGWHWTGVEILTPQAEVDIHIEWINEAGEQKEHTETVRFPNILRDVPVPWLKDRLEDLILLALRKKLNMDLEKFI